MYTPHEPASEGSITYGGKEVGLTQLLCPLPAARKST
jgi:hypothetical protein